MKRFKVSFELSTDDADFTGKDIEADLERFQHTSRVEIENIKIKKMKIPKRTIPRRPPVDI